VLSYFLQQEIGWQNKEDARRVLVLTTDAAYHCAGDGLVRAPLFIFLFSHENGKAESSQ